MSFVIADRVKETSTTTGTGALTLAGAITGFSTFASRCSVGDTCYYAIQAVDASGVPTGEWECGLGTYSGANTLTRTTVTSSSASDAAVSFAAGDKQVYITMPAVQAAWARERLTADRTYYVRTDGSDSNTGLADTAGGAFLTIQQAVDVSASTLDTAGFNVTILVADGTYTSGVSIKKLAGGGSFTITGNVATPTNAVISVTSGGAILNDGGSELTISGFKLSASTGYLNCLQATKGSRINFSSLDFGACSGEHISAAYGGNIICIGNYAISGGAGIHWAFTEGGFIRVSGFTVTLSGTPAFSPAFAYGRNVAGSILNANTFTGAATGSRYNLSLNSTLFTNGAGASYLPGNAAGATTTGGQYA